MELFIANCKHNVSERWQHIQQSVALSRGGSRMTCAHFLHFAALRTSQTWQRDTHFVEALRKHRVPAANDESSSDEEEGRAAIGMKAKLTDKRPCAVDFIHHITNFLSPTKFESKRPQLRIQELVLRVGAFH